jgi:hypothetical protein
MKNWKTTLCGLVVGFANLWANGFTIKAAVVSSLLTTLGLLSKDHNVTGGDVSQSETTTIVPTVQK